MSGEMPRFKTGDLVLIVDVQKDFCPGGALPIDGGDEIVPRVNVLIDAAQQAGVPVYLSRDWHPKHHISFQESGGQWPPHCLQDRDGARFHPDLLVPHDAVIVTKGTRFDQDQNSAFDQTGLADWLKRQGTTRIYVAGLALDVCVLATALDGLAAGFEVCLLQNSTRPVTPQGGEEALAKMDRAGIHILDS